MECDLCGKTATAVAEIEGAKLTVCDNCAKHGKNVKQLPSTVKQKPSSATEQKRRPIQRPTQEISEGVRRDFAKVLQQERAKRKLTQEEFAKVIQIKLSTYHHFESGSMLPDIELARKLEHMLKIPLIAIQKQETWDRKESVDETPKGMSISDFILKKKPGK